MLIHELILCALACSEIFLHTKINDTTKKLKHIHKRMQTFMIFTFIMFLSSINASHAKTKTPLLSSDLIESISIEHINSSLGSREAIRTITLSNNATHKEQFAAFLSKAQVFDISFDQLIQAHIKKEEKVFERVRKKRSEIDSSQFTSGGIVSNFTIHLKNHPPLSIHDLRYYKLNKDYHSFIDYLAKHGSQTEALNETQQNRKPLSAEILEED